MSDEFPRQSARTQRFTLGEPRDVVVSPDGERVVFLRSRGGDDPINCLWVYDVADGTERLVADPIALQNEAGAKELTDGERARRERMRDGGGGIGSFATDAACKVTSFALDGELYVAGLLSGSARPLPVNGPVFDPRPDPTASRLAYVSGNTLRIAGLDGSSRVLAGNDARDGEHVSYGSADFIAAEEMRRFRGYWWSPDGTKIAVCRVDDEPVEAWTSAEPSLPGRPARTVRYPAAGTSNPIVTLHIYGLDGLRRNVDWDAEFFPYLAHVDWTDEGLLLAVQSRDQRGSMAMKVDLSTGEAIALTSDYDDAWIENVPGVPRLLPGGALLSASDRDGVRRLYVDDVAITPDDLQVRSVLAVTDSSGNGSGDAPADIVFTASDPIEPTEIHVWSATADSDPTIEAGSDDATYGRWTTEPGVHSAAVGGTTVVLRSTSLDEPGATWRVLAEGADDGPLLTSHAERPSITPNVTLVRSGERDLATAVLLPHGHDPDDDTKLPVLMDPYGGPHAQRVLASHNAYLAPQWFADQGFAVVVVDGRGSPGRGAAWEREIRGDLATLPLTDQVDALHDAAEQFEMLDLDRVAIRGWSFGGYLAALAVLDRPDVFHAAIAGAPVTEWRLYDTHYTERYLGDPNAPAGAAAYAASSLLGRASALTRPLLLIHGMADDNVVAAHTMRMSSALLAAGRPHEVLPLAGVSHMTPQEVVAENLLRHQLEFLGRALGLDLPGSTT